MKSPGNRSWPESFSETTPDPLFSHKAEVARATGISRSTITNELSGRRQISKENVIRLAAYFHVDPGVFLPEGQMN